MKTAEQLADMHFGNAAPTILESSQPGFKRPGFLRKEASIREKFNDPEFAKAAEAAFVDEIQKVAFQTSMYSGPLSYGGFKMDSSNPGFRMPQLLRKQAAPTTLMGMAANSRSVGKIPKITMPGASIADQSPRYGRIPGAIATPKLPGAKKGPQSIT